MELAKKSAFFVTFILSEGTFLFFSKYIVYWITGYSSRIYTEDIILHTLLLLVFKIVEYLQCILNRLKLFSAFLNDRYQTAYFRCFSQTLTKQFITLSSIFVATVDSLSPLLVENLLNNTRHLLLVNVLRYCLMF